MCNFRPSIWHPIAGRNCDRRLVPDVRNVKILIIRGFGGGRAFLDRKALY